MKWKPVFRILALAAILSVLVVAIPAIATYAVTGDESISLQPDSGNIGDSIGIRGSDFEPDDDVDIYFTSQPVDTGDDIDDIDAYELMKSDATDEDGHFATHFDVPDELTDGDDEELVSSGDYLVFVTYEGDDEIVAVTDFAVAADESLSVDPDEGEIGDDIDIEGQGLEPNQGIDVYFTSQKVDEGDALGDLDVYERVASTDTDDDGEFSTAFSVPAVIDDGDDEEDVTPGTYYVFVTYEDDEEIVAVGEFAVTGAETTLVLLHTPPGWEHGKKTGWGGGQVPPGWSKGNKTGWNGQGIPPGLMKAKMLDSDDGESSDED